MRYRTKTHEMEALRWQGPLGDVTFRMLQDWGAPVTLGDHKVGIVELRSAASTHACSPGDWIVRDVEQETWHRMTDEAFRARYESAIDADADPLPGYERLVVERVAFRRRTAGGIEVRHGGLTRAEAAEGGWTALYAVELPS